MQQVWNLTASQPLLKSRQMSENMLQLGPPLFRLTGLAVGNGLTDPALQVGFVRPPAEIHMLACAAMKHTLNGFVSWNLLR